MNKQTESMNIYFEVKNERSMKYVVVFLFLLLFAIVQPVFSLDINRCIKFYNISCEKCVSTDIKVIGTEGVTTLFVGDTFNYNITLTNIGNETLNQTFLVSVYNPTSTTLSKRVYLNRFIVSNDAINLEPIRPDNLYDIYPLDISGSYSLEINSSGLIFYRFYENCKYIRYVDSYTFYFDAMPQWQYKLNKNFEQMQKSSIELLNQSSGLLTESVALNKRISELSEEIVNLSRKLENLTIVLLILAFIPVLILLWQHSKKYWRPIIGMEGLLLTLIGFIFTYSVFVPLQTNLLWFISAWILILLFVGLPSYLLLSEKPYKNKFLMGIRDFGLFILAMINLLLVFYSLDLAKHDIIFGTLITLTTLNLCGLALYGVHRQSNNGDNKKRVELS